jgi:hypothetical protein
MTKFTTTKLDWLKAVRFDRRVTDYAARVAGVIVDHLNAESGRAFLAGDTIAFETGSKWRRKVVRAVKLLRDLGYLEVHRTANANIYTLNHRNVRGALAALGRARFEKRRKYLESTHNHTAMGHQRPSAPDGPPTGTPVAQGVGHQRPTNPLSVPVKESLQGKTLRIVRGGGPL